ncbi:MAG: hypothetical protein WC637_12780 [Victivallales bacterium]|jgi:hypothetical protein
MLKTSNLRADIFRLLDKVIETGHPLEIERKGKVLQIIPKESTPKLSKLSKHDCILCNPDELIHMDWEKEWKHDIP